MSAYVNIESDHHAFELICGPERIWVDGDMANDYTYMKYRAIFTAFMIRKCRTHLQESLVATGMPALDMPGHQLPPGHFFWKGSNSLHFETLIASSYVDANSLGFLFDPALTLTNFTELDSTKDMVELLMKRCGPLCTFYYVMSPWINQGDAVFENAAQRTHQMIASYRRFVADANATADLDDQIILVEDDEFDMMDLGILEEV